jgi:hypothetical protein
LARRTSARCHCHISPFGACAGETLSITALPTITPLGNTASASIMPICSANSSSHDGGSVMPDKSFDHTAPCCPRLAGFLAA